jgi:phosphate transport system substrate-binding protein
MIQAFKSARKSAQIGRLGAIASAAALSLALAACGGGTTDQAAGDATGEANGAATGEAAEGGDAKLVLDSQVSLTGAGASFPAPLYQRWFIDLNKKIPNLQVNYQSVGSGAGVEQFTAKTVNFGASDTAMKDEEIAKVNGDVMMLPMTAGSIVIAYNLPGVEQLNLTQQAMLDIFLGKITQWNDPAIAAANEGVELPDLPITVVHRSDGSGTTGVFTKNLSAMSPEWESSVGEGKTVEWPTGVGAKGNEGVTAQIQQTEGAIGYIEYGYAKNNNVAFAALENKAGEFVVPTAESTSATLAAVELPEDMRAFVTNPDGPESYPIVTYTWMLVYPTYDDPTIAKSVEAMIEYGLNEGQEVSDSLGYIPLPPSVREQVAAKADSISPDYTIEVK